MKMSFEEIIENVKGLMYEDATEHTYQQHHNDGIDEVVEYLNKIKPERMVIPECVDVFLKNGLFTDKLTYLIHQKQLGVMSNLREGPIKEWMRTISKGELLELWNGYDVEPEQIGEIVITIPGEDQIKKTLPVSEINKLFLSEL